MIKGYFLTLVLVGVICAILAACGRRGELESSISSTLEDRRGNMLQKPGKDKSFIFDHLIR